MSLYFIRKRTLGGGRVNEIWHDRKKSDVLCATSRNMIEVCEKIRDDQVHLSIDAVAALYLPRAAFKSSRTPQEVSHAS